MKRRQTALLTVLLVSACTAHAPHRLSSSGEAVEARVHSGDLATPEGRRRIGSSALEIHDDFQLLFLEFDDQGSLFSRAPLDLLVETLRKEETRPEQPRLNLVLFAHGWKSDARACNRNACCFRSLLSRLAADSKMIEARSKGAIGPSRTIGIFVGWRGLSATVPPFRELSFYARKRAATKIGEGELVEVLTLLDRFQKHVNEGDPTRCRLVILGHSFGGAMVYSAVANVLKSRFVDAQARRVLLGSDEPIAGFGDLVVLANPAFEASLYQPFQELIDRSPSFSQRQRPVLLILASETDTDTRVFFKIGRSIATLFQRTGPRSPRPTLVTTVGNYDPFVTHRATARTGVRIAGERPVSLLPNVTECECRLPISEPSMEAVDEVLGLFRPRPGGLPATVPSSPCPGVERMGTVELSCATARPLPFWVVRASNDVMSGHSGFFTTPMGDLVRGLLVRTVLQEIAASQTRHGSLRE